ncbi:DUF423 domain-containing protein [Nitrincola tapanii]|uniref:DUF423 domain-containing protein n=1 Tax=Nitrincola tapanii TaxID=1708751 RepID=A0A5A9W171_9GAMM|nr:DUF423 domain-containing protein [Nitrincola tapanii]KAA0874476.1 DUF423 domain-containing protein [Nitrincola tapanii]
MARGFLIIAALLGMLAVILGAFGAHALAAVLDARQLTVYQTAVSYQFWHALALLAVALLAQRQANRWLLWSGISFLLGVLLFCGSLYAMTLTGWRQLGIITPFGGLAFILGWVFLALSQWRQEH